MKIKYFASVTETYQNREEEEEKKPLTLRK